MPDRSASSPGPIPPERTGYPAPAAVAAARAQIDEAVAAGVWRTDPAPEEVLIDGVPTLCFRPAGRSRGVLVHFHGGAYRIGRPAMVAPFALAVAERHRLTVICPAYRLAPEHPFPAAVVDGLTVVRHLAGTGEPLLISGDSAGGGLAASVTAAAIAGKQAVAGLILLSAWLDLTLTSASYGDNAASDPLFSRAAATDAAELYLQGFAPGHPLVSPLLGSVINFPPVFVSAGAGEVLADDAIRFATALREAGVPVSLSIVAGMDHVAVTRGAELSGATETFAAIATFLDDTLPTPS